MSKKADPRYFERFKDSPFLIALLQNEEPPIEREKFSDVFCAECGAGLCNQTDVDDRKKKIGSLLSILPFSSYAYLKRLSEELEKAGTK